MCLINSLCLKKHTQTCLLPFQIFKGDLPIPRWLSPGAKTMIKRMLDPNPITRMTIAGIKDNDWFNHNYTSSNSDDEDNASTVQEDVQKCFLGSYQNLTMCIEFLKSLVFLVLMVKVSEEEKSHDLPIVINAFELIGMSSFLDLSGLFETEVMVHSSPHVLHYKMVICS